MSVESKRKTEHLSVKEVRLHNVLWDTRYGRTAHSFTFSSGMTFGMLRKFWKLHSAQKQLWMASKVLAS